MPILATVLLGVLLSSWSATACDLSPCAACCGGTPICGDDDLCQCLDGPLSGAPCTDDDNPCTLDQCSDGVCLHAPVPDGTSCSDGAFCNGEETCSAGFCNGGTPPCTETCSEAADRCFVGFCAVIPQDCRPARHSKLAIKNKARDTYDTLLWKWTQGAATSTEDFANPQVTAHYALCIYSGPTNTIPEHNVYIPPNSDWTVTGGKWTYRVKVNGWSGAQRVVLKPGAAGKSSVVVQGRGGNLPDTLDVATLTAPVTVQLINYETGACFEGRYETLQRSDHESFSAKQ